jgi:hypothetical protein
VLAVGRYALAERDSLVEVDINPLVAGDARAMVVDALIIRRSR